jgi:glycosyltransferase involved in cell wall biosynthesis
MDVYRGFPQFIEAIAHVLDRRPNCHVAIVAAERVAYGKSRPDGTSYKDWMLQKVPLDLSRVHFIGTLPYKFYRKVIQSSSVHVYLTRPFVLSWSMLEAMSTGCLLVASNTPPVTEVIRDGENGLLVDFFNPQQIADRIDEVLDHGDRLQSLRNNARQTILDHYARTKLLPQHLQLLDDVANRRMGRG